MAVTDLKLRILYLMDIMLERTDDAHALSAAPVSYTHLVQPSQINTRSPSFNVSNARTPRTAASSVPLYRAKRMEKEVSGTSAGVILLTFPKAWLSVMTSAGAVPILERVSARDVYKRQQLS